MGILQQYFHAIGGFNALLLSLVLIVTRQLNPAGKILSVWLIAWAIYAVSPLLLINSKAESLNLLHVFALWVPASFGALLYLHLTFSIRQRAFVRGDLVTFLPFVICLLLNLDYALMSDTQFASFRDRGVDFDIQHITAIVFLYGQALFFFCKSYFLISLYRKQTKKQLSNYDPDIFKGLLLIISTNLLLWLLEIFSAVLGGVYFLTLTSDILFTIYLCALGLLHWRRPNFFCIEAVKTQEEASNKASNHSPLLDASLRDEVFKTIIAHMQTKQPFLNDELSLTLLSEQLSLSKHYVSEAINNSGNKNFHQFVNEYRVNWFCEQMLARPKSKVLDLALESGFSSKSAFNMVFKQITHQTPSQFKASITA